MRMARVVAAVALGMALALGATAQTTATAETPATALPANPPTCTAKALGVSRASNPGLAADCDTLLAIQSTLRVSGWVNYDAPSWWDHSYALNWSARTPLRHWRVVTLGGTPQRVVGLDFSDTRESVRVFNARTRQWEASQPFTREWTLRGVIPTQLGRLTALETLDLGGSELTGAVPTQLGALTKLTRLDLSNNKLTGELPTELDDLESLGRVWLAGNGFTGCAPAELWRITSHDLDTLGLPNCKPPLTYGAPSRTGIVDAPGEHAFFTNNGPAITYEGLRNDVVQVVIHKQDAGGTLRDAIYDDVEVGDDFEWREASDCWVRYLVERVLPAPTDVPLKVLAVRRYGYAYTGCSGQVSLTGSRTLTWIPPNIQSPDITVPVRHGPWLLVPPQWTGATEEQTRYPPPTVTPDGAQGASTATSTAQWLPPWREPVVPEGWTFKGREWGDSHTSPLHGYDAYYDNEMGYPAVTITVAHREWIPALVHAIGAGAPALGEIRIIEGYSALLYYSPEDNVATTAVKIFDHTSGIEYAVLGHDRDLRGNNIEGIIPIALSLLP